MPKITHTATVGQASSSTPFAAPTPSTSIGHAYGGTSIGDGPVVIRELTGDQRTITLSERAKPYKPMTFGGEHRIEVFEYDGYPQVSQQALGAKESDSEWKGAWKTRFIGDTSNGGFRTMITVDAGSTEVIDGVEAIGISTSRVLSAAEAAELMDDIRRKGQTCRVSYLHLVRIGKLAEFVQNWNTPEDVEWTMKWKWIGRDEDAGLPSPGSGTSAIISAQLSAKYIDLQNATNFDAIDGLDPGFADMIDSRVGRIQRSIVALEDNVGGRIRAVVQANDAIRRALTISAFITDECETFIGEMGTVVGASMRLDEAAYKSMADNPTAIATYVSPLVREGNITGVSPGDATAARIGLVQAIQATRKLKHAAGRQKYAALKQLESSALAVVLMAQGDDLRGVSKRFYGTSEEAEQIRAYNKLTTLSPPTGTVVVVPQRTYGR